MKKNLFAIILGFVLAFSGTSFAQAEAVAGGGEGTGIHLPLFLGAALGFGSGTGVGNDRGLGLRQLEPMFGVWYPGIGFARVGYGFFEYQETPEVGKKIAVDHSDFDIELGAHLFGIFYLMGAYSRAKELSDLGDVAWNEWAGGFGSLINIFAKTMLFSEISYHWVNKHYDPFQDKSVTGSRLQFNIGFAAYVY